MARVDDLSRSLVAFEQPSTLVVVVEMSKSSWLVTGLVPGITRQPLKKLAADCESLLRLVRRWQEEAVKAGRKVSRTVLAYEAGRDGFWLARWLRSREVESYVIHPTSVAVSREHKRAKTDRLDTALLLRAFLGWLRGEPKHCTMAAIPTLEEEDAKRPNRERDRLTREQTGLINRLKSALARLGIRGLEPGQRKTAKLLESLRTPEGQTIPPLTLAELGRDLERLALVREQLRAIEKGRRHRLQEAPDAGMHPKMRLLNRVVGLGEATADTLAHEIFYRPLRDEKAVGRYGGMTGSPQASGKRRREQGLAKAGNAKVRQVMLQLAWRMLLFQKESALVRWYQARIAAGARKKTMIMALARKLLVALWRLVTTGEVPEGFVMRSAV
jgi:transposase